MRKHLNKLAALGLALGSSATFAVGTVPTAIQTAITEASETGTAVMIAVVVGLAAIGLLKRGFSKAGV